MTKARDLADLIAAGNPLADGAISVAEISDLTASAAELNNVAGINSSVQTQLDAKAPLASPTLTGTVTMGGTTYPTSDGTEGQVLTTNGSGAVSFSDPAGGGSADFVASGAIANGDVVVLNSDGTVSVVAPSTNPSAIQGSSVDVEVSSGIGHIARNGTVYDPVNKKVVVSYKGKVVVGTVSSSSISFGSAVSLPNNSGTSSYTEMSYDPVTEQILFVYTDSSTLGTIVAGSVSGSSISFGSPTTFTSGNYNFSNGSIEYDESNNKFVVFWRGANNYGNCAVATVSGTSVTMGTSVVFNSNYSDYFSTVFDTNINRVVVAYRQAVGGSSSEQSRTHVVSVSGTTPSFTSVAYFYSSSSSHIHAVWDSHNSKMVIIGRSGSNSFAVVATPSTSGVTFGSPTNFESGTQNYGVISFDPVVNKVLVIYVDTDDSNLGKLSVGTVSGTSISFASPILWSGSTEIQSLSITYASVASRFFIGYRQPYSSERIASFTYALANGVPTTNAPSYIGVADGAISNSATGKITINGGVNEGQSSLAVGTTYYVADNGNLQTTNNGRKIGKAISATKLLVNSNMSGDEMNAYLGGLV